MTASTLTTPNTHPPRAQYQTLCAQGVLQPDLLQQHAVETLNNLYLRLLHSPLVLREADGKLCWQPNAPVIKPEDAPFNVYMFGTVGRGKSMLMDIFFNSLPTPFKRRVHFHAFMEELHQRMHTLPKGAGDPVHRVAMAIAKQAQVLCFDEFYITNIADAMLLGRFMEKLFACGVVVVCTSNWAPKNLFFDGHNRQRFQSFIRMIEGHMHLVDLEHGTDWRRAGGDDLPKVFSSQKADTFFILEDIFKRQSGAAALSTTPVPVVLAHTPVPAVQCAAGVVWFSFDVLCAQHLSRDHYLELSEQFQSVILSGVPLLPEHMADAALRFITLVDILYEHKKELILSTDAPLFHLCPIGDAAFAFQRTISRVVEMQNFLPPMSAQTVAGQ